MQRHDRVHYLNKRDTGGAANRRRGKLDRKTDMTINPDSISQVLSLATIDELARELRKRGACYAIVMESDVLAQVQTSSEYQNKSAKEQLRIAQDMFEANVEGIQDAMARGGEDYIGDLIPAHAFEFGA